MRCLLVVLLLLLSAPCARAEGVFARQDDDDNDDDDKDRQFIRPPPGDSDDDFSDNMVWYYGDVELIEWSMGGEKGNVSLRDALSNDVQPFGEINGDLEVVYFPVDLSWLTKPPPATAVLYFVVENEDGRARSHYFNVTHRDDEDEETSDEDPSSTTQTEAGRVYIYTTGLAEPPTSLLLSSATTLASNSATSSATLSIDSADPSPAPADEGDSAKSESTPVGKIIGASVGATVGGLMILGALGILLWRRWRRQQGPVGDEAAAQGEASPAGATQGEGTEDGTGDGTGEGWRKSELPGSLLLESPLKAPAYMSPNPAASLSSVHELDDTAVAAVGTGESRKPQAQELDANTPDPKETHEAPG